MDDDRSWGHRTCQSVSLDIGPWAGDTSAWDVDRRRWTTRGQNTRTPSTPSSPRCPSCGRSSTPLMRTKHSHPGSGQLTPWCSSSSTLLPSHDHCERSQWDFRVAADAKDSLRDWYMSQHRQSSWFLQTSFLYTAQPLLACGEYTQRNHYISCNLKSQYHWKANCNL